MPKKPKTKPAAKAPALKLEFEPRGCTMQRREAIKKNRQSDEKAALERELEDYCAVMRQLFKQGFVSWYYVSNDTSRHQSDAKGFRTSERMEVFEAKRIAARKAQRKARHAS